MDLGSTHICLLTTPVTHLVLFATTFFTVIEDIVTGVVLWEQKGLFDLSLPSHQQEERQEEGWKSGEM